MHGLLLLHDSYTRYKIEYIDGIQKVKNGKGM